MNYKIFKNVLAIILFTLLFSFPVIFCFQRIKALENEIRMRRAVMLYTLDALYNSSIANTPFYTNVSNLEAKIVKKHNNNPTFYQGWFVDMLPVPYQDELKKIYVS